MSYASPRGLRRAYVKLYRRYHLARTPKVHASDYNRPPHQVREMRKPIVIVARGDVFSHKQTVG